MLTIWFLFLRRGRVRRGDRALLGFSPSLEANNIWRSACGDSVSLEHAKIIYIWSELWKSKEVVVGMDASYYLHWLSFFSKGIEINAVSFSFYKGTIVACLRACPLKGQNSYPIGSYFQ